jgi:hypothetical protein
MKQRGIEELRELLKEDRSSSHARYPQQAVYALNDDRVAQAIDQRLQDQRTLTDIKSLGFSFLTGLNRIYFEFSPARGIGLKLDAVLVFLNSACNVVAIVDPFDPDQPNPDLPALPARGGQPFMVAEEESDQPFVLARPSEAQNLKFAKEALYPLEVRSRRFLEKLAPNLLDGQQEASGSGTSSGMSTHTCQVEILTMKGIECYAPDSSVDGLNEDT